MKEPQFCTEFFLISLLLPKLTVLFLRERNINAYTCIIKKISPNGDTDYTMRVNTKHISFIRIKFTCLFVFESEDEDEDLKFIPE